MKEKVRKARQAMENMMVEFRDQRQLLSKILSFDLHLGQQPALTITKKLARETSNDAGEQLNNVTASIMVIEFKKFLFLTALRIKNDKEKKLQTVGPDGKLYFSAPFPAPPMIEKAWDLIILYSDTYVQLC